MMVSACKIVALFGALRVVSECHIGVSGASGDTDVITRMGTKMGNYYVRAAFVYGIGEGSVTINGESDTFKKFYDAFHGNGDVKNVLLPSLFITSCDGDNYGEECRALRRLQVARYIALVGRANGRLAQVSDDYDVDVDQSEGTFTDVLALNNNRSLAYRVNVCGVDVFNANFSPSYTWADETDDYWKAAPDQLAVAKPFDYFKTLDCSKPGILILQDLEQFSSSVKNTDEGDEFSEWLESCNIIAIFAGVSDKDPESCHSRVDPLVNKVPVYKFSNQDRGAYVLRVRDEPWEIEVILLRVGIADANWGLIGKSQTYVNGDCT